MRYLWYEFVASLQVTLQINFHDSRRSIRYGCQTVVEKSAADDSIRTYELLVDVAVSIDPVVHERNIYRIFSLAGEINLIRYFPEITDEYSSILSHSRLQRMWSCQSSF